MFGFNDDGDDVVGEDAFCNLICIVLYYFTVMNSVLNKFLIYVRL